MLIPGILEYTAEATEFLLTVGPPELLLCFNPSPHDHTHTPLYWNFHSEPSTEYRIPRYTTVGKEGTSQNGVPPPSSVPQHTPA